jgi:hypothetical protein
MQPAGTQAAREISRMFPAGHMLTVRVYRYASLCVLILIQSSFATQVFLHFLFLRIEALVLAGRSLRETISALIALWLSNPRDLYDAQRDFHERSYSPMSRGSPTPCDHPVWAVIDLGAASGIMSSDNRLCNFHARRPNDDASLYTT